MSALPGMDTLFFFVPFIIFAVLCPRCSSSNSDPVSHSMRFSPPPSLYGTCLAHFIERGLQPFLPSSTRAELHLPTLSGDDSFFF